MCGLARLPTGSAVLDRHLQGGIPQGYVVNLRGEPGSGKTVFATQLAYKNALLGRKTLYVSFLEDREKFVSATSTLFPKIGGLLDSKKIVYIELSSIVRGGVGAVMELVLERVREERPEIVVFDSYSALQQAVGTEAEARSILSNMFSRVLAKEKITSFIITEGDHNDFVSYVADGILRLGRRENADTALRELQILKMRSVSLRDHSFLYVFERGLGLRVLSPFRAELADKVKPKPPLQDRKSKFSTGSRSLDGVMGGYPKSSLVLWEMGPDIPSLAYYSAALTSAANFLAQRRGLMVIPSLEFTAENIRPFVYPDKSVFEECARMFLDSSLGDEWVGRVVVQLEGDKEKDVAKWNEVYREFKKHGKPVLKIVSLDLLEHLYGSDDAVDFIRRAYTLTSHYGDVKVMLAKPGLKVTEEVKYMASIRLKLRSVDGYIVFKSEEPHSGDYVYEASFSRGRPEVRLYEIN